LKSLISKRSALSARDIIVSHYPIHASQLFGGFVKGFIAALYTSRASDICISLSGLADFFSYLYHLERGVPGLKQVILKFSPI
jgi:hypothetical protein